MSSELYTKTPPNGFHIDDVNFDKEGSYGPLQSYAQSKLANILFVQELDLRLKEEQNEKNSVFSLHPGVIATNLTRNLPGWFQWLGKLFIKLHLIPGSCSPTDGIKTTINCATKPGIEQFSGQFFSFSK